MDHERPSPFSSENEHSTVSDEQRLQKSASGVREEEEYVVRRLIPKECARLQGFPPDWCDDVPHSDSAEYKLWGNGIALPCLLPMMKAMGDILRGDET